MPNHCHKIHNNAKRRLSPSRLSKAKYIAEIEEVRINPIVSKKGFLNFLEEKSIGWSKKFVVLKCFFLKIFRLYEVINSVFEGCTKTVFVFV